MGYLLRSQVLGLDEIEYKLSWEPDFFLEPNLRRK
jgi:hypothetical protein